VPERDPGRRAPLLVLHIGGHIAGPELNHPSAPEVHAAHLDEHWAELGLQRLGEILEGASRPGHFAGVLTVVLKLFELTHPSRAYFGQKDFQQVVLVRQLVRDFALPLRVVACPTVREADGLAMSSRNAYLSPTEREAAPLLRRALAAATQAFGAGASSPAELESVAMAELAGNPGIQVDYLLVVDETTLRRPDQALAGNVLAIAVKLGSTRLIDNAVLGAERF